MLVDGGNVVVGGGYDLLRAEDFQSAVFQSFECLGAGDLVDKMFVDVEDGGAAVDGFDDVAVPDLFK